MLQDDGLQPLSNRAALSLNSEHCEDVAILCDHLMRLRRVVVVLAVREKLKFGLGVDRGRAQNAESQKD